MSRPHTTLLPSRFGWQIVMPCDPYQSLSVSLYGEWAAGEQAVLSSLIKPGDVIIDVGANIGTRAIPFGVQVGPGGKVLAIEPQRLPYLCLCGSVALNSLEFVVIPIHAAAGAEPGEIQVPIVDPTQPNNVGGLRLKDNVGANEVVTCGTEIAPVITLDSLGLDRCSMIKVDVEGMEPDVLAGAVNTVDRFHPVIWAETLPHEQYSAQADALRKYFTDHKYKAWVISTPVYVPRNSRLCLENPYGDQRDHNVFAIPQDVTPPNWIEQSKAPVFC